MDRVMRSCLHGRLLTSGPCSVKLSYCRAIVRLNVVPFRTRIAVRFRNARAS
jgi:hypothetical protein